MSILLFAKTSLGSAMLPWSHMSSVNDTVGEFQKRRTYAFYSTEFKDLARLKLDSPTVSVNYITSRLPSC
jgi:hypothetical protein